jgi:hypothetical protein
MIERRTNPGRRKDDDLTVSLREFFGVQITELRTQLAGMHGENSVKLHGIEQRMTRVEHSAWAVTGAIALAGALIKFKLLGGVWLPAISGRIAKLFGGY